MSDTLRNKTSIGLIWSSVERFSSQGVQFLVMLIMARLLTPKDYGIVGMLSIFIAVSSSIVDSGFGKALVRKQDRSETDNSTVFYFNLIVASSLYLILYICAPYIAVFFNTPELTLVTRVICLLIVFNSMVIVPKSIFIQKIDFKTQAKASLTAAVLSGIIGVYMAFHGCSYWALVTQLLSNSIINALCLWIFSFWKPKLIFSITSFKELFGFGSKLLLTGILERAYQNIYPLIIGKAFSADILGYYSRAHNFSDFPSSNFTGIIQGVSYPAMCAIQDDDIRLKSVCRKFLKLSTYIIFPFMAGMACLAYPMVVVVIGQQWAFSSVLLQIIIFQMMWYPVHAININIMQVKGRSDYFLYAEIIKKIIYILLAIATIPFGIKAMCYGAVLGSLIELFVNTYYSKKVTEYGILEQIKDILPIIVLTSCMVTAILLTICFFENLYVKLLLGVFVGISSYLLLSLFFHFEEIKDIREVIFKK